MENEINNNLSITANVYPLKNARENLLAFASVNIGDAFAIRGVKVLQGKNGPFVSMPQMKNNRGEWQDVCFPTTKEMRETLNKTVLKAFQLAKESPDKAPAHSENSQPQQSAPKQNSYAR